MITALYNRHNYLRVATGLLLIFLIGLKIFAPVFIRIQPAGKEISQPADENNDGEKKAENYHLLEKEKEFAGIDSNRLNHLVWFTDITHHTAWHDHYRSSYHRKVTIPPPDVYLQVPA